MTLEQQNAQKITNRMDSVIRLKDLALRRMMTDTLNKAMEYALKKHTDVHINHLVYGNTYGWMLVHNGAVEELVVNSGKKGDGRADSQLLQVASLLPDTGWHGVVLATMNAFDNAHDAYKSHAAYYSIVFEDGVLIDTANFTATEFDTHFKRLKVT